MADDQIERIMMKLKREEQWQKPILEKKEERGSGTWVETVALAGLVPQEGKQSLQ